MGVAQQMRSGYGKEKIGMRSRARHFHPKRACVGSWERSSDYCRDWKFVKQENGRTRGEGDGERLNGSRGPADR
jgi:hypothetical protein